MDDPSSTAAPVDGNDVGGVAQGPDHRGDGAWRYAGLVVGNSHPTLAPATTDAAGHAALPFEVSMRPGDNYRVGAARDSGELVYDLPQDVADGRPRLVSPSHAWSRMARLSRSPRHLDRPAPGD